MTDAAPSAPPAMGGLGAAAPGAPAPTTDSTASGDPTALTRSVAATEQLKAAQEALGAPATLANARGRGASSAPATAGNARGRGASPARVAAQDQLTAARDRATEQVSQLAQESPEAVRLAMDHVFRGSPLPAVPTPAASQPRTAPTNTAPAPAQTQPSPRPQSVRAVAQTVKQQIQTAPNSGISEKDKKAMSTRLARLVVRGGMTYESAVKEMDRALGKRKLNWQGAGDQMLGFDEETGELVTSIKLGMTDYQAASLEVERDRVYAATLKAQGDAQKARETQSRDLYRDREAFYKRIQGSFKNKEMGRQMAADADAAINALGLDIRAPGISAIVENATRTKAAWMENGWFPDRDAPRGVGLTPFILADAMGFKASDGDALAVANDQVISPLRVAASRSSARVNEQTLVGGVANAIGYGVPAQQATTILMQYLQSNPDVFAGATPQRIGAALAADYEELRRGRN